jgi:ribonuclease J
VRVTPLGGCGEFGLHSTLIEGAAGALCVDAGLQFPDELHPGVDFWVPDFGLLAHARVQGYLLTHGHDDHVGALAWALTQAPAPVWGTPLTLELARGRLEEHGHRHADLRPLDPNARLVVAGFEITPVPVFHSVPGAVGFVIAHGDARVYVTGDHKGLAVPPPENIDLMLADSTGALRETPPGTEEAVARALESAIAGAPPDARIVIATFASNVERIARLMATCGRLSRTAGLLGRSLVETADAARRLGLLSPPPGVWVPAGRAQVVVVTGGQGEPAAVLARLAAGEHSELALRPGDRVLLSGRPIPGNERAVARVCDALARRGVAISDDPALHASGHGSRVEIADLIASVTPHHLIPVHAGARHLRAHVELALAAGARGAEMARNGDRFRVERARVERDGYVEVKVHAIENGRIVPQSILEARQAAARAGVLSVAGEQIATRGIAGVDPEELGEAVRKHGAQGGMRLVRKRTGRRPLVIDHTNHSDD